MFLQKLNVVNVLRPSCEWFANVCSQLFYTEPTSVICLMNALQRFVNKCVCHAIGLRLLGECLKLAMEHRP